MIVERETEIILAQQAVADARVRGIESKYDRLLRAANEFERWCADGICQHGCEHRRCGGRRKALAKFRALRPERGETP